MARGDKGRERRERRARERESVVTDQVVHQVTGRHRNAPRYESQYYSDQERRRTLRTQPEENNKPISWLGFILFLAAMCLWGTRMILGATNVLPFSGWAFTGLISAAAACIYFVMDKSDIPTRSILLGVYGISVVSSFTLVGPTFAVQYPHGNPDQAVSESGFTLYNPITSYVEVFDDVIDVDYDGRTYVCTFTGDGLALFKQWGTHSWQKKDVRQTVNEVLGSQRLIFSAETFDSLHAGVVDVMLRLRWPCFVSIRPKDRSVAYFP